jgi:hypothetical protein
MRSRNLALLAFATVVSISTAAAILALDHAGILSLSPATGDVGERNPSIRAAPVAAAAPTPAAANRFAYAPLDAIAFLSPPADEPLFADEAEVTDEEPLPDEASADDEQLLRGTVEPDIAGSWLAEIQPEKAEPSGEEQRQTSKPRMMTRSPALTRRLAEISPGASKRLAERFDAVGATWTPADIALVAIKDEKALELFARPDGGEWKFIHRYPVLAASGRSGPKLRQGDKQVPEGVYNISFLNPHSRYHVSLRVNYPNAFDRRMAALDGRSNLGGDIMIHGKAVSVGCLAVGDAAAEELFLLAANVGLPNIKLIIAPTDFRRRGLPTIEAGHPKWLPDLYTEVATAMAEFKAPPRIGLLSFFGN